MKKTTFRSNMKMFWLTAGTIILLIIFSPVLFRTRTVTLLSSGKTVTLAKRPIIMPWDDNQEVKIYVGKDKMFGLWTDIFHGPIFIYPFQAEKKFLCSYNDDIAILVFVVDFNDTNAAILNSTNWPLDEHVRKYITSRMTNIVMNTKGMVRLPELAELVEVTSNLAATSSSQLPSISFPCCDLGLFKSYASKGQLLTDLATNRQSFW